MDNDDDDDSDSNSKIDINNKICSWEKEKAGNKRRNVEVKKNEKKLLYWAREICRGRGRKNGNDKVDKLWGTSLHCYSRRNGQRICQNNKQTNNVFLKNISKFLNWQ